jgi:hypothetical protein
MRLRELAIAIRPCDQGFYKDLRWNNLITQCSVEGDVRLTRVVILHDIDTYPIDISSVVLGG